MFNVVVVAEEENNRRQEVVVVRSNKKKHQQKKAQQHLFAQTGCYPRWSGAIGLRYTGFPLGLAHAFARLQSIAGYIVR